MKVDALSPSELRAAGYKALADALGPRGMAKFLRQFGRGRADYTNERQQWLSHETVQSVAHTIRTRKKSPA